METRAGTNTTTSASNDGLVIARSSPVPIPLPNHQRTPQRASSQVAPHYSTPLSAFTLDQRLLDALEADEAGTSSDSSSDEEEHEEDERKTTEKKDKKDTAQTHSPDKPRNTVFNILSSSPLKLTISPPLSHLSRGNRTPPILNLSPLPSPKDFQKTKRKSRSGSPRRSLSQQSRLQEFQDPTGNTILNILGSSPGLTLTISHPLTTHAAQQGSPLITLSPHTSPAVSPRHSRIVFTNSERDESGEQNKQDIQIILPETDPLLQWAIDLQENIGSPKATASLEARVLQQTADQHDAQILPTTLLRQASINPDLEAENRCKELLKDLAYHLVLVLLVSPNAMNAFCEPSGVKPANVSLEWWNSLSGSIQFLSIVNALFSLGVNVFVQRDYIPQALKELKDSFGKCFSSVDSFLGNALTLVSSAAAAFSFAAMSYEAFKWLGEGIAVAPGLASLGTSFTTRYPSVKKGAAKTRLFFNKDQRFQKAMADDLRHLKKAYANELNLLIRTKNYKLQSKDIALLLNDFASELEGIPKEELLNPKTKLEFAKEYTELALEAAFATLISSTAFLTFTQKGFDGTNAIAHLLGSSLKHLTRTEKFAIGVTGGAVSSILYYIAALNFMPTVTYVGSELLTDLRQAIPKLASHPMVTLRETYQNPQRLLRFLTLSLGVVAVWRSSGAMVTVGSGVSSNPEGIFTPLFEEWASYASLFPAINGAGGIAINLTAVINQILKKEKEAKRKKPELNDVATFMAETPLPTTFELQKDGLSHPINTISQLKQFSLFKPASSTLAAGSARAVTDLPLLEDPDLEARPVRHSFCPFFQTKAAATPSRELEMALRRPREIGSEDEDDPSLSLLTLSRESSNP